MPLPHKTTNKLGRYVEEAHSYRYLATIRKSNRHLETNKLNYDVQGQVQALELTQALTYTDPLGSDLGYDPATLPQVQIDDPLLQLRFGDITDYSSGCMLDGVRTNCNIVQSALNNGWGVQAPEDLYGSWFNPSTRRYELTRFTVDWDNGYSGFVPLGATYGGSPGTWYHEASDTKGHLAKQQPQKPIVPPEYQKYTNRSERFIKCANESELGSYISDWYPYFSDYAADLIRRVSQAEKTAPELLAVTWEAENGFVPRPKPNTNGSSNTYLWDIGPFHVNVKWTTLDIKRKAINVDDLDLASALGGHLVRGDLDFAGDPYENGRLAAKRLNAMGTGATAAAQYGPKEHRTERKKKYEDLAPKFKKFFDCLNSQ